MTSQGQARAADADAQRDSGRTWRYRHWLYNPLHRLKTTEIYDLLGTEALTERGIYLNLGYWNGATTMDEASEALVRLVAETAALAAGDQVLDVGFGFADQDLFWCRHYQPASIIGLNITASQVRRARARVAEAGLDHCIRLLLGSATAMPLPAASVDRVLALECAFHFRDRDTFFREAARVLRPGGRLVTADILPRAGGGLWTRLNQRWSWRLAARQFAIPRANAYGVDDYRARLTASGFQDIRIESIRDRVYAPLHDHLRARPDLLERLHPALRGPLRAALRLPAERLFGGLDYVIAVADKP